ncbi:hypothetical protein Lesp02_70680 [Lentzea sp. NBRC 105346]|uniref:phage minor capsid protein n=1 Tax=Lentzea sp. NBRC 105346 TaxID=3032205 RepID=UPI0024A2EA7D|nr:phage minor capsid protein [Lentzea sp. NBRC 105346]GLZ34881.1 hypothetical protein Lesp02_70680 [Lentzea sp. NBRC 105346]
MKGVNPADAYRVLKTLTDVWDAASERMLTTVTRRLARGVTEPGWAENKSREVLLVRAELRGIVEQHLAAGLEDRATAALEEAYGIGAKVAERLDQTSIETDVSRVVRLAAMFVQRLRGTFVPVTRSHEDVFTRAIGDTELLMQTGTIVRREAVAEAVDRLITSGVDRFRAEDGKQWHLDSYVRMAGRTMAQQAAVEGQLDGMVARGRDLIVVSDSARECALCRPWEGKLLSITGASVGEVIDGHEVESTVALARAAGLWHPNCTHRGDMFTPGLTLISEPQENPAGYAEAQNLRRMERHMRQLKRQLAAVQQLGDTQAARRLRQRIRAYGHRIEEYATATGQNRRRERERPVGG